jgi:REP-associated tyrosine transposase
LHLREYQASRASLRWRGTLRQRLHAMSHFDYQPAYRRNLRHLQPPGATFFLTFRLAESLPQEVIRQFKREQQWLAHLARTNPTCHEQVKKDFERTWFAKFELLLDGATVGPVWLSDERVASIVAESLHHRDGKAYRLDAFTIMANHVHAVIKPLPRRPAQDMPVLLKNVSRTTEDIEYHSLASIMQSLKGYTAFHANQVLGRKENSGRMRATIIGSGMLTNGNV